MEIAVVGISYKEADVALRGEAAFTTSMKKEATRTLLNEGLSEFMILSTCNRSEIFLATNSMSKDIDSVKRLFKTAAGPKILPYLYVKKFEAGLQHIYQVAAGLDSLVLGEDEILGQMKGALAFANEAGSCRKYLNKVVRESIAFSKKVRHAYKLSENQLSVASIGVRYLKDQLGDLKDRNILLVGTGCMGRLILRYLEAERIPNIYLTNRTVNRDKMDFIVDKSVHVIEYNERYEYLKDMDVVISATASPHTIFRRDKMEPLTKPVVFLDMAVPRDIDERIDTMELAQVITLDTFIGISDEHLKKRHDIAQDINRLILEEVKELELWLLRSKVDGIIEGLHNKQNEILKSNIAQVEKMGLSGKDRDAVIDMLRSSTWQMVSRPVQQLKTLRKADKIEHYKMLLEELFDLEKGTV